MTEYLIRCVNTEHAHSHIVSAEVQKEIGTHYVAERETLQVSEIIAMMADGDGFNTYSPSTDKIAYVHKDTCDVGGCKVETLRSDSEAVKDNNLDNLICS